MYEKNPTGVGLGLRLEIAEEMTLSENTQVQFVEVAPENYMRCGGKRARLLAMAKERWPVVCHGLCGDFSGSSKLDMPFMLDLKQFLRDTGVHWYSDHLCLTQVAGAEIHDLVPLPFTEEAASRAAKRIREVQDLLELPIAIENASAYIRMPGGTMSESEFVTRVAEEADCKLLLDVNNVYVNSMNFAFEATKFLENLPLERVIQIHMAGHYEEDSGLLIDTHGADIIDPVYELLDYTLGLMKVPPPPILLERDNSIPALENLERELAQIECIRDKYAS